MYKTYRTFKIIYYDTTQTVFSQNNEPYPRTFGAHAIAIGHFLELMLTYDDLELNYPFLL